MQVPPTTKTTAMWMIEVQGEGTDISRLASDIGVGDRRIEPGDGRWYAILGDLEALSNPWDISKASAPWFDQIIKQATLTWGRSPRVSFAGIARLDSDGAFTHFICVPGVTSDDNVGVPRVLASALDQHLPGILLSALLTFGGRTEEGQLVAAVGKGWFRILEHLLRDPSSVMQMSPRKWEEFVAGCYEHDGYDVTLTRQSGDMGRDVIATKRGVGTIRVLDQVKRYKPGHVVTAEEVRAFLFVAQSDRASKGFITTTSDFAPELMKDKAYRTASRQWLCRASSAK
jgi:Restriction endonuclease